MFQRSVDLFRMTSGPQPIVQDKNLTTPPRDTFPFLKEVESLDNEHAPLSPECAVRASKKIVRL